MPIDLSGSIYAQFEQARRRAEEAGDRGANAAAAAAYRQCSDLLKQYARYISDPGVRATWIERSASYHELAARAAAGKLRRPGVTSPPVPEAPVSGDDYRAEILELVTAANTTWDDIGGLEQTKRDVKTAYGLAVAQPPTGVRITPIRNMLFYGPPGTGKTSLAAATSRSLDAAFFNVKLGSLLSKYFGESTKLITTLYSTARERAPAVVFLDEIESLAPPRGSGNESGAERRVTTALLVELEGLQHKGDDRFVLTIGATNVPWLIDKAMLSRFEKKIYIPLPDQAAREAILRIHLERQGFRPDVAIAELARRTEGLSGREIGRACKEAVNHMIARANPDLLERVDQGRETLARYQLRVEPLNAADTGHAFDGLRPETSAEDLDKFARWRAGTD